MAPSDGGYLRDDAVPNRWEPGQVLDVPQFKGTAMASETSRRELGHDEFDPVGTLALITLYFLLLVILWLFMYFVEFLGNEPTVVGMI